MQMIRAPIPLLALGTATVLLGVCQFYLCQGRATQYVNTQTDRLRQIPEREFHNLQSYNPFAVRAFAGGHLPVAVDVFWMRSLQDDLKVHYPPGTHAPPFYEIEVLQKLDPFYFEPPLVTAVYLSVARDDGDGAVSLLSRAEHIREFEMPSFPESVRERYWNQAWAIPMTLGYVFLFDFQDMKKASAAYSLAAEIPGVPDHVRGLAKRFETQEGRKILAERVIRILEPQAERNPILAERLKTKRDKLLAGEW